MRRERLAYSVSTSGTYVDGADGTVGPPVFLVAQNNDVQQKRGATASSAGQNVRELSNTSRPRSSADRAPAF